MRVFISWSGELSHKVALVLRDWLPSIIQAIEPYVSSEDMDKGARWFSDIASELESSDFGIVCLTRDNMNAPWILFEAGAISKKLERSRVSPLLIDLSPSDLEGPLVQFQATTISKLDMFKLLKAINKVLGDKQLSDNQLERFFEKWWPDFETKVENAVTQLSGIQAHNIRTDREVLEEVLQLSRTIAQSLTEPKSRADAAASPIVFLEGAPGTGKTRTLLSYLAKMNSPEFLNRKVVFLTETPLDEAKWTRIEPLSKDQSNQPESQDE